MWQSVLIIVFSAVCLTYFYFKNSARRIERYYLKNDKGLFVLLEVTIFVLVVSIMFNIRHIIVEFLKKAIKA